jgi:hypothetical protein
LGQNITFADDLPIPATLDAFEYHRSEPAPLSGVRYALDDTLHVFTYTPHISHSVPLSLINNNTAWRLLTWAISPPAPQGYSSHLLVLANPHLDMLGSGPLILADQFGTYLVPSTLPKSFDSAAPHFKRLAVQAILHHCATASPTRVSEIIAAVTPHLHLILDGSQQRSPVSITAPHQIVLPGVHFPFFAITCAHQAFSTYKVHRASVVGPPFQTMLHLTSNNNSPWSDGIDFLILLGTDSVRVYRNGAMIPI